MKQYRMICGALFAALVLTSSVAEAWGPRAQLGIVNTALQLVSREQNVPLTRLQSEVREGAAITNIALEELYPDMAVDPLRAIENEMALLTAARGARIDAYFAWRLGALGKLVGRLTAPMALADPNIRGQYHNDVDKAIDAVSLKPGPRKSIDAMNQLERIMQEANASNSIIESEYQSGAGFQGAAATRLAQDASRSVNAVADVWWTIIASKVAPGNVSETQLHRYVLSAYAFYIARGNASEIDAAYENYSKLVSFSPDVRARIGDMLFSANFKDRAVKEYEAVLAAAPERRDMVVKIGDYYAELAEEALQKELLEEALAGFEKALEVNALHPSAEQRRLEVEALIRERNERQESYQLALRQAEELRSLAEEEAARAHYPEAIALFQQSEEAVNVVGDEFPMEAQQRARHLRDVQARLNEVKQSLLNNVFAFSGAGFGPDLQTLLADSAKGIDREAFESIIRLEYDAEIQRLMTRMQPKLTIE